MDRSKRGKVAPRARRWVTVDSVVHWRSKKRIFRKDGKPFRFPIN